MINHRYNRFFDWLSPFYDVLIRRPEVARHRALLNLPKGALLLDVGGGTGPYIVWTPQLARSCSRIRAISRTSICLPLKAKDEVPKSKSTKVSRTDKDAGYMVREGKPKGFFYLDHRTVDDACQKSGLYNEQQPAAQTQPDGQPEPALGRQ